MGDREVSRKPLHPMSDSVHLWRLGEAAREAADGRAGDLIDLGLILLRLLNEHGYAVIEKPVDALLAMAERCAEAEDLVSVLRANWRGDRDDLTEALRKIQGERDHYRERCAEAEAALHAELHDPLPHEQQDEITRLRVAIANAPCHDECSLDHPCRVCTWRIGALGDDDE